jgi:hypothetical protein
MTKIEIIKILNKYHHQYKKIKKSDDDIKLIKLYCSKYNVIYV